MVDPVSTSRDSELSSLDWNSEFFMRADEALHVAAKRLLEHLDSESGASLAALNYRVKDCLDNTLKHLRTNGKGIFIPDSQSMCDLQNVDYHALVIATVISYFVQKKTPLYVIVSGRDHERTAGFLVAKIRTTARRLYGTPIETSMLWGNPQIYEMRIESLGLTSSIIQRGTPSSPGNVRLHNYSSYSTSKAIFTSMLGEEHCFSIPELLEQWMNRRSRLDLRASLKGVLRASNLPLEQWAAELRSLADEIDPKPKPLPLPDKAPELFANRPDRRENIEEFLRRVWMPWIETGTLTRPAFARLDQQGEMALRNWLRKNTLPPDIRLPTLKEVNDLSLADPSKIREAERLAQIARRRRFLQQAKNTE